MKQKHIIISRGDSSILKRGNLTHALNKKGFLVWNHDYLTPGSDRWWQAFEAALDDCHALVAMIAPSDKASPQTERELRSAREHGIPIIPLLFAGNPASSIPDDLKTSDWIDVSSNDQYAAGLEKLFARLDQITGINVKANHPLIQNELQQITVNIPEVRWIRLIHIDGFVHRVYRFDAGSQGDTQIDLHEDRLGAMSIGTLSLSEKIAKELVLGNARFTVISGQAGTHFFLALGDGTQWFLSFAVRGNPSINQTIQYFETREFLAHIVPLLGKPS